MVDILSPSGVELPAGGESHSRALVNRNFTRINDTRVALDAFSKSDKIMCFSPTSPFAWAANAAWDAGALVYDSSNIQNTPGASFCGPGSLSGTIKFLEAGIYTIVWVSLPQGNPGAKGIFIQASGTWPGSPPSTQTKFGYAYRPGDGQYWENICIAERIRISQANLEVRLHGQASVAHSDWPVVRVHQVGKF